MEYGNNGTRPNGGAGNPPKKKKKKFSLLRLIGKFFLFLFTLLVIGVLTAYIFFNIFMTYVNTTLIPSLDTQIEALTMNEASTIYYQNNNGEWRALDTLFASEGNRKIIEYSDLPQHLIDALVAIEDHRFWTHHGVDWEGTLSAFVKTFTTGSTRGGSTITQQMLRNTTRDNDVTVKRKVREIFRALEYEKTTSKEDILTMYLNYVYFGDGCDGIQTAAENYFGKDVRDLTLAESAAIIAITNNPSLYDPFRDAKFKQSDGSIKTPRDFNKARQELILDRMADPEIGYITKEEAEAAKAEFLMFTDTEEYKALHANDPDQSVIGDTTSPTTWFVDAVIDEAIELLATELDTTTEAAERMLFRGGYHIYTTLDMDIQNIVDSVYKDQANFDYPSAKGTPLDSAITITDPYTGDVVAMAGGVGEKTQSRTLNLATSPRPCGSSIKPVSVYAPAIDSDVVSPISIIDDYPIRLNDSGDNGYPKNSNNKYRGYTDVAYGVQWSLNTLAVRTLEMLGTANSFYFMEENLGFNLDVNDNAIAPLAMGGLTYGVTTEEMAAAFGAFANEGIYTKPRTITQILANDNETVVVDNSSQSNVAMKKTTAYLMNKLLRSVVTGGTGGSANFNGMTIAGKTGTTNNNFDRYFVGYTPYYSAAVWVGYSQSNEKINAGSKNPAALVWKQVMEQIHANLENKSFFEKPEGITSVSVCADCGLRPNDLCSADVRGSRVISMEIQASAVPKETCTCHMEVKVCTDPETGEVHLAGDFCPEETCSTRVMLQGRPFLEIPYGSPVTNPDGSVSTGKPIVSTDSEYHLTYLQTQGYCAIHDEFFVSPEEPMPGDPGYEWPGFDWPEWIWPGIGNEDPSQPTNPTDPSVPGTPDVPGGVIPGPTEPSEPSLPQEPLLP